MPKREEETITTNNITILAHACLVYAQCNSMCALCMLAAALCAHCECSVLFYAHLLYTQWYNQGRSIHNLCIPSDTLVAVGVCFVVLCAWSVYTQCYKGARVVRRFRRDPPNLVLGEYLTQRTRGAKI